jgi:hypothetical protein
MIFSIQLKIVRVQNSPASLHDPAASGRQSSASRRQKSSSQQVANVHISFRRESSRLQLLSLLTRPFSSISFFHCITGKQTLSSPFIFSFKEIN